MRVVVIGLGKTGESVVRHCVARGDSVVVIEDNPMLRADWDSQVSTVTELGAKIETNLSEPAMLALIDRADLIVPSPGVPERHPALHAAITAQIPVRAEIDLAGEVSSATLVAVTGTNGKTTVTTQVTEILQAADYRVTAAGNIGLPLLDAANQDWEVIVAEVSSFQLAFAETFHPKVAAILNLGADHLDWHRTFSAYAHAKARIFANQLPDDVLVFNADDPVVAGMAANAPSRVVSFSVAVGAASGYRVSETAVGELLVADDGSTLIPVLELEQRRSVDLANALAASAIAQAIGAPRTAVTKALQEFRGLAHRMELVAVHDEISWYNDSKATNVHATLAAVRGLNQRGLNQVVLIAGGRNKGIDLGELQSLRDDLLGVVAIGEAAMEVQEVFAGVTPVVTATTMTQAVQLAREFARPGSTVLLSPSCASFDWYSSYAERGDDFARNVRDLIGIKS